MKDIVIIIPAYQPHEQIMKDFLSTLKKEFTNIVIVDDGSGKKHASFFEKLEKEGYTVLRHYMNYGKGRAIKTAFNYCLNEYSNLIGVITADCDGQHSVKDIKKCAEKLKEEKETLVIGTRNFNEKQVPLRSRFGNKLTRTMFNLFVGIKITDTQSGLRAFGKKAIEKFLTVNGERFEYETNMLIKCKEEDIKISEVPIDTIYINNNELSHFNPIKDSIMIYKLFIKYIIVALSSFLIDIGLFTIFMQFLPDVKLGIITSIVMATILARIVSSTYNFLVNKKIVFKKAKEKVLRKYYFLVIVQMFISAFLVSNLFNILGINSTILKIVVDIIIFIINFYIQREWVFK